MMLFLLQFFELSDGKIDLRGSKEDLSDSSSLLKTQRKFYC